MHNKKRFSVRYYLMTACLLLAAFVIGVGHADWITTFSVSGSETKKQEPVCYIKGTDRSKNRYFMSIEKALDTAKSGEQVNVIPGTNPTIKKDCEIKTGVTLNIPPQEGSKYQSTLVFGTGSDNSVVFKVQRSYFDSSYTDYLIWSGKYSISSRNTTIPGTNWIGENETEPKSIDFVVISFSEQNYQGYISTPYITSITSSFSCSYTKSFRGQKKYTYTYSISFPSISFLDEKKEMIYIGSTTFSISASKQKSIANITDSNINTFSNGGAIINNSFEETSSYSPTATYSTTGLNDDNSNVVTIDSGVTLTNNGNIYVGGTLAGGSGAFNVGDYNIYSGHTFGTYSKLVMKSKSTLNSTGNLYCYGYIKEEPSNNGSLINCYSGTVKVPFVVRDFKGGGVTVSCANDSGDKYCFPFNQYEVRNITPEINYHYGTTVVGMANLYAGDQQNAAQMNIIGTESDSFIQLNSSYSCVNAKFNEQTVGKGVCDLKIIGGCILNAMKLTISVSFITKTVSSTDFCFPISYRYRISLLKHPDQRSATFIATSKENENRLQFLPGSSLTLGQGCVLQGHEMVFYKNWKDKDGKDSYNSLYADKATCATSAYFMNNGTASFAKCAGLVKSEVEKSYLKISGEVSYTNHQISGSTGGSTISIIFGGSTNTYFDIVNTLSFYSYSSSTNTFDTTSLNESVPKGEYTSIKDANGVIGFKA